MADAKEKIPPPTSIHLDGKFKSWTLSKEKLSEDAKDILELAYDWSHIDELVVEQIDTQYYALVPWKESQQGSLRHYHLTEQEFYILLGSKKNPIVSRTYTLSEASLFIPEDDGENTDFYVNVVTEGKVTHALRLPELQREIGDLLDRGMVDDAEQLYDVIEVYLAGDLSLRVTAYPRDPKMLIKEAEEKCIRCHKNPRYLSVCYCCEQCTESRKASLQEIAAYDSMLQKLKNRYRGRFNYPLPKEITCENLSVKARWKVVE